MKRVQEALAPAREPVHFSPAIRVTLARWAEFHPLGQLALIILACIAVARAPLAAEMEEASRTNKTPPPAVLLEVEGPVGPAMDDYLERAFQRSTEIDAPVIIIQMDTPGGLDTSMRAIVRRILDSPTPVAVYIAPEGARGASAGTYILYAAHVAAMAPATSVGAATPVQMGGVPGEEGTQAEADPSKNSAHDPVEEAGSNQEEEPMDGSEAMQRKVINDAVSYLRGLAELRGRNADWAEKSVRQGATLTSSEALEKNVINYKATDVEALLAAMDGLPVEVDGEDWILETAGRTVQVIEPDWRTRLLSILTNPNVAYILMLLGIYGIIMEFSNPGTFVPGIAGAICLLLALFSLHLLPINYAGAALIFLGILLMLAEAFAPSFGALGVGGAIAFLLGSILLIDTEAPGFELHISVIIGVTLVSALIFTVVFALAMKAWRRPVVSGSEGTIGAEATALEDFDQEGRVRLKGELWKARTNLPLNRGDRVKVKGIDGLTVSVEPFNNNQTENKNHD